MKKTKSLFLYLTCLLLWGMLPLTIFAQQESDNKVWTLQNCMDYARQNNIQLKQLAVQTRNSALNQKQSKDNQLPSVNGSSTLGLNIGRAINPADNTVSTDATLLSNFNITGNYTIYNGGIIKNTIEQRNLEYQLAQLNVEEAVNNLNFNILTAYLQILLSEEQLNVLAKQAELTDQQYKQTNKLIKAGLLPKGDILNIEAQIANDDLNRVNGENSVATAYLSLSQALDLYEQLQIAKPQIDSISTQLINDLTAEMVYEDALNIQPQIKTTALQNLIAKQQLEVARGGLYPTVSLLARFGTDYASLSRDFENAEIIDVNRELNLALQTESGEPIYSFSPTLNIPRTAFFKQIGNNFSTYIGINVNVPIFNQFRVKNTMQQAQLNIENSRLSQQVAQNNLRRTIEQALLDAKGAAQRYKTAARSATAFREALAFTQKRFKAGTITSLEYLTAQNSLTQAELNVQSAKYEYLLRLKILDFYRGKPLNL